MGFLGRWLSDSIRLGLALVLALSLLQVPALTEAYLAALAQTAAEARRDIDQRLEIARQHYRLPTPQTEAIAALRPLEPANAEGLEASLTREAALRGAHARLLAMPELLRPLAALRDLAPETRPILSLALAQHRPTVLLGLAPAIYGLAGLMLGLLLAQLLLALLSWPFRPRRRPA